MLEKWVFEHPEKEFIVYPDRNLRFTYSGFNERTDNLAKGLLYIGVRPGDKVAIWAKNVPDWLTFMFATAKIGAVLVPVNTACKASELAFILERADVHTLCLADGYRDSDFVDIMLELVPEVRSCARGELLSEKFPFLRNLVFIGQQKHRGMFSTQELMLLGTHLDNSEIESIQEGLSSHDVVTIQFTGGTTGVPKGVMLSHHNILNNGYSVGQCMKFTGKERLLVSIPLFHTFGNVLAVCAIVSHGATMVLTEEFDPVMVLASIQKERCSAFYGVPTMFINLLSHPMFELFNLESLRTGIIAGAPCPVETVTEVMSRMHIRDIISVYGLTESSPGMTATRTHNSPNVRATTVGFALPNVEVKIVDKERGTICQPGEEGEICCRGYNVMKGYYKDEEATLQTIDAEGWLHSGDLAVQTNDGFYQITGRIKEMIIRGGEQIYPGEVEDFIHQMPQVEQVEVVGIPSRKYGEEVAAFIVIKAGEQLTEEEVTGYCRGKIAKFKIPQHIFFLDALPLSPAGKVQKFKLTELAAGLRS